MTLRHSFLVNGPAGVGVASPQDARLALASLLSGPGLLSGFVVTGSTSGPNMKYAVSAGVAVTQRGTLAADGLYLVPNDGPVTVDSGSPAPGSGTRWDLVWVRQPNAFDGGFGDSNSDPVFGVTVGTAGSGPTKPYASVPAGALVLAESSVGASIASASLATITMVAASSSVYKPADTGWQNITMASAYAGSSAQVRLINGEVHWQGSFHRNSGAIPNSGGYETCGTLPAGFAPPAFKSVPLAGYQSTGANSVTMRITSGSTTITLGSVGTASSDAYVDNVHYLTT